MLNQTIKINTALGKVEVPIYSSNENFSDMLMFLIFQLSELSANGSMSRKPDNILIGVNSDMYIKLMYHPHFLTDLREIMHSILPVKHLYRLEKMEWLDEGPEVVCCLMLSNKKGERTGHWYSLELFAVSTFLLKLGANKYKNKLNRSML